MGDKLRVTLTKTSAKSAGKPAKRAAASVINAVSRRKVTKAAAAEASKFRPDLKVRFRAGEPCSAERQAHASSCLLALLTPSSIALWC